MNDILFILGPEGAGQSYLPQALSKAGYHVLQDLSIEEMEEAFQSPSAGNAATVVLHALDERFIEFAKTKKKGGVGAFFVLLDAESSTRLLRISSHPLQAQGYGLGEACAEDDFLLGKLRPYADMVLDTTRLEEDGIIKQVLSLLEHRGEMTVRFLSCGFRFGTPRDANLILDCRNAPNPFWDLSLRDFCGLDEPIIAFMESHPETEEIYGPMRDYIASFLVTCKKQGRRLVNIYLACTGGQHRSVYFASRLYKEFEKQYRCETYHRDQPLWRSNHA
ncbi:MAG: hypothetical protein IJS52_03385 [Bacilli bacterium]|nr:hypothetical protein [Bacilli bacterium]